MPVALITGASRGLGRSLAHELAADGWSLVLDARGVEDLAATIAGFRPDRTRAVPGDVTDPRPSFTKSMTTSLRVGRMIRSGLRPVTRELLGIS